MIGILISEPTMDQPKNNARYSLQIDQLYKGVVVVCSSESKNQLQIIAYKSRASFDGTLQKRSIKRTCKA